MSERRWLPRVLGVGVMLALLPLAHPVEAQAGPDPRLERIRSTLAVAAVERIEASLAEAERQGIPVEPLLDKAVEGIAKNVPGQRIAAAVGILAGELVRARALLRDGVPPTPTDVAAVADALRRGVPEPSIRRLAERAGQAEPVALAVHTLGDLIDRNVPVGHALSMIEAWRERGADAEELRELPAAVERLVRQGVPPEQAAAAVAGAMRGGNPPGLVGNPGKGPQNGPPIPPGAGPPTERGNPKGTGKPPGGGVPTGG